MIIVSKSNEVIVLKIQADIINTSSSVLNLDAIKSTVISQLSNIYNHQFGKYTLNVTLDISILTKVNQCSPKKVLFQIVDSIAGNNPAEADFKGLRVKLNKNNIQDFISDINFRTLPHELGHLLGLDHPHGRAAFESINPEANPLEKQLSETQRQHNLMSQTWYIQKANVALEKALELSEQQIELILLNYNNGGLNKNKHLKYFLWWRKIMN